MIRIGARGLVCGWGEARWLGVFTAAKPAVLEEARATEAKLTAPSSRPVVTSMDQSCASERPRFDRRLRSRVRVPSGGLHDGCRVLTVQEYPLPDLQVQQQPEAVTMVGLAVSVLLRQLP